MQSEKNEERKSYKLLEKQKQKDWKWRKKNDRRKKKGKQKRKGEQNKSSKKIGALNKLKKAALKIGKAVVEAKSKEAAEKDGLTTSTQGGFSLTGALNVALNVRDSLYQYLSVFLEELATVGKVQQPAHTEEKGERKMIEKKRMGSKVLEIWTTAIRVMVSQIVH